MTPLAQQLAMAELDGWREAFPGHAQPHPETKRGGILLPYKWVNERTHERRMELPDYLGDLNAVHGVEAILSQEQFFYFCDELGLVLDRAFAIHATRFARRIHAKAGHRTEAILRTLGKWTD